MSLKLQRNTFCSFLLNILHFAMSRRPYSNFVFSFLNMLSVYRFEHNTLSFVMGFSRIKCFTIFKRLAYTLNVLFHITKPGSFVTVLPMMNQSIVMFKAVPV